jgi:hypothetical protein
MDVSPVTAILRVIQDPFPTPLPTPTLTSKSLEEFSSVSFVKLILSQTLNSEENILENTA